jgi:hypothetical protein
MAHAPGKRWVKMNKKERLAEIKDVWRAEFITEGDWLISELEKAWEALDQITAYAEPIMQKGYGYIADGITYGFLKAAIEKARKALEE